jgi:hypothetical protein
MNWNKIKAISLMVVSLGFVTIGFQNCSKVGVQDLGSSSDSKIDTDCLGCTSDGTGTSGNLPDDPVEDGRPHTQPLDEEAVAVAQCLQKEGLQLAGPDVVDVAGNVSITSDLLNLVSEVKGNVKIHGKTDQAHAKQIEFVSGNILLCGLQVDSINEIGGNVILVNSKVANIHKINGNLRLFHSEVGSASGVNGNIR